MRAILVGAMVALVAMASPAFAGGITDDAELRMHRDQKSRAAETSTAAAAPATRDVVVEEYHSAGAEFGLGIASTVLSLLYFPPRAIFGLVGAELGGVGGWSTGGDLRTGKALWRPTVEGDYFIRPDHLDGTEHFDVINTTPVFHGHYTVHEVSTYAPAPAEPPDEERYEDPDDLDLERSSARESDERVVAEHARELTSPDNDEDDPGHIVDEDHPAR